MREDLTPLSPWLSATAYTDATAVSGETYHYAVRTASDAEGTDAGVWCDPVPGYAAMERLTPDAFDPAMTSQKAPP